MRIYNRGRRVINPNTTHALRPGTWTEIPDEDAKKLLRMFPKDLTSSESSPQETKLVEENQALQAELVKLKEENAALKKEMAEIMALVKMAEEQKPAPDQTMNFSKPAVDLPPTAPASTKEAPKASKKSDKR